MSRNLLIGLVDELAYIKRLTLCGMKAVDDDTLEQVSFYMIKHLKLWIGDNPFLTLLGEQWSPNQKLKYLKGFLIN